MGCCSSQASSQALSPGHRIKSPIVHKAPKTLSEIRKTSELYERVKQIASFKCEITGLLTLHNYICLAREKKDVHNLLIFEVIVPPIGNSQFNPDNSVKSVVNPTDVQLTGSYFS
jgi:hypothetical protein